MINSLKAEKLISLVENGQPYDLERWRLLYREPGDCLLEIYDAKGALTRSKHYHGLMTSVRAGAIHQEIQNKEPQGWKKVVEFFGLKTDPKGIADYRELSPGTWVPNSYEPALGAKLRFKHTIVSATANVDLTGDFAARGH